MNICLMQVFESLTCGSLKGVYGAVSRTSSWALMIEGLDDSFTKKSHSKIPGGVVLGRSKTASHPAEARPTSSLQDR